MYGHGVPISGSFGTIHGLMCKRTLGRDPLRGLRWGLLLAVPGLVSCSPHSPDSRLSRPAGLSVQASAEDLLRPEDVSFVQITDAHLFDAGKGRHGQAIYTEALDNRAALHWAVIEVNRMAAAEQHIDFVVFTGDWGLENVRLQDDLPPPVKKCECPLHDNDAEGPIAEVTLDAAVREVVTELNALVVPTVYLVPGDSDLCRRNPKDLHRYAEFVFELQNRLPGRVTDLTHSLEQLVGQKDPKTMAFLSGKGTPRAKAALAAAVPTAGSDVQRGFHLLALNSASFETQTYQTGSPVEVPAPGYPQYEIHRVLSAVRNGESYLIFTHIPDLKDPAPVDLDSGNNKQAHQAEPGVQKANPSAWRISENDLDVWEKGVGQTEILGIFAGHFHSPDRALYGVASTKHPLAVQPKVARKTWVAPPLSNQFRADEVEEAGTGEFFLTRTARGFLRVTVNGAGWLSVIPHWYVTMDQDAARTGDLDLAVAIAESRDGHWDAAAAKFADAMKSNDSRVRASAEQGFVMSRGVMGSWWWQMGKYVPPLRWTHIHPARSLSIAVLAFVLLVAARPYGFGLLWLIARAMERLFMPRFRGYATVLSPKKLTEDAKVDLFAAEISQQSNEVGQILEWFGRTSFAGPVTLLSLPSQLTGTITSAIPEVVKGVNLTKFGELVMALARYFTWRVESQIGFCGDTPVNAGGAAGPGGELRAFATLRWAWFTKGSWGLDRRANDVYDLKSAAFGLAARIVSEASDRGTWR